VNIARRGFLYLAGCGAALPTLARVARAQAYPSHPVRLIVGFTAGGPTDIFARLIGQWLSDRLGQPFIIENRPGAGSTIGIEAAVNATPDGYTLAVVSTSAAVSASFYQHLNFNLIRDIVPVSGIVRVPLVMVVHPSVPATTGTTPHMAGELFKMMAAVDLLHIPYRGAAPALTDLLGGRAQVMFEAAATLVEHVRDGRLRALAVAAATGSHVFPDIPTVGDFLPGYDASVWFGIGAPKQTPAEIVDRLNQAINAGLADPVISARLAQLGGSALTGSSAEFGKLFVGDTEKWGKVVRAANIKAD
jgi:tripartite-type tricarboxylate transporter receptor subunit TctC